MAINFSLSFNLSFLFILHDIRLHWHLFTDVPRFNFILPLRICGYNFHQSVGQIVATAEFGI